MKSKSYIKDFGKRLATIRKTRGLTQEELAKKIGLTRRVILYYENESEYPATHILIPLSKALKVSVEELLGLKKGQVSDSNHAALWRKLKKAEGLSKKDQKAVIHYIEALINKK